ncbi:MAG: glycosyltransferase [Limnospira sp. PMC 1279.21]|uniref:glycosyltransferase n=1 Tax=Limnospira sp. PMC 1279.21 TaxID=2981062 RepID=UPI0028E0B0D5|nr:glycosyltransferase [Limnospira sp. PMC 1279.21]MDT9225541.1 glycosyltransferase [Limnospira sp. PMC 1279.21]
MAWRDDLPWSHYNLAEALVKLERWEAAVKAYKRAMEIQPDLPCIYEKLGDALRHQVPPNLEEISQVYYKAIEANPDNLQIYYRALEANPQDAKISLMLADAFRSQGQLDQAVTFYKNTLQIAPNNTQLQINAWQNLGDIWRTVGRLEEAEKAYHQIGNWKAKTIPYKIVLFTPYYKDQHPNRQDELIYCLRKNIECPEIEKIVLLIDDGHQPELENPKIEIIRLSSRATYLDWVKLTQARFADKISVLANTDIYLDQSISWLRDIFSTNPNAFIALSRHEQQDSEQTLHKSPHQSQDLWAVYGGYNFSKSLKKSLEIPLGFPRCDAKIAYLFSVHGAKVYNPCNHIKIVHLHETQLRSYDKYGDTTILGSTAWVYPSSNLSQPSKLKMNVWTLNPDEVENIQINNSLIRWQEGHKEQGSESREAAIQPPAASDYWRIIQSQESIITDPKTINNHSPEKQTREYLDKIIDKSSNSILLSSLEKLPTMKGISLVTCCMNRNDNLVHSLKTWLKLAEIDEIIIVDWNSNIPVSQSLQESGIKDDRILIAKVIDQPRWILTLAYNVGLQLARYDKILKIDADNKITSDFFEKNQLVDQSEFFAGDWKYYENRYLNGTFYVWKKQLSEIGYFNEYIQTYGWDDTNLYERLTESGLTRKLLLEETLSNIEHSNDLRLINQIESLKRSSNAIEEIKSTPEYLIQFNRYLTHLLPDWKSNSQRRDYLLLAKDSVINKGKIELLFQAINSPHIIPDYLTKIAQELALRMRLWMIEKNNKFIWEDNALNEFIVQKKIETTIKEQLINLNNQTSNLRQKETIFSSDNWHIIFNFSKTNPLKVILAINHWLDTTYLLPKQPIMWIYPFFDNDESDLAQLWIKNYINYRYDQRLKLLDNYNLFNIYEHIMINFDTCSVTESKLKFITQTHPSALANLIEIKFDNEFDYIDVKEFIKKEMNLNWLIQFNNKKEYIYYQILMAEIEYQENSINQQIKTDPYLNPLISIVTSVYQGREFIQGFLENITKQTIFSQCELILIDGNSPENEGEIIEAFIHENGFSNIHYHRLDKDPGLYECWNIAIRQSHGKYITNANLDDRRSPLHLEILANHLENNPQISAVSSALVVTYQPNEDCNFFTPEAVWFDGLSGEITFDDLYKYNNDGIVVSRNTLHCMPLWKKDLHSKYGYFDEPNYGTSADWEFWLRCSYQGEKYSIVGLPLGLYYLNPNSHNRINDSDGYFELRIIKKYFSVNQEKAIKQ